MKYQVISAHDYYRSYRMLDRNWRAIENLPITINAPMRARDTLLAQKLRTGKHLVIPALPYVKEKDGAKDTAQLVGRLLGVEIEYYPSGYPLSKNKLRETVHDGSLGSGGRELRKLTWTSKAGRLDGLLCLKLEGRVDKSCGLHVHVDARHLGINGLLDAAQTYDRLCGFYPHLKKLVPKSRRKNTYCQFKNNRYGSTDCTLDSRYAAINWQSYERHGTIEFRCQGGSLNLIKIESWSLLCQFLLNFAARPENTIPHSWNEFLAVLPEPLRSWCLLRHLKLNGPSMELNERTLSATL